MTGNNYYTGDEFPCWLQAANGSASLCEFLRTDICTAKTKKRNNKRISKWLKGSWFVQRKQATEFWVEPYQKIKNDHGKM